MWEQSCVTQQDAPESSSHDSKLTSHEISLSLLEEKEGFEFNIGLRTSVAATCSGVMTVEISSDSSASVSVGESQGVSRTSSTLNIGGV